MKFHIPSLRLRSTLLFISVFMPLLLPASVHAGLLSWSDDVLRWVLRNERAYTPKAAEAAVDAGRYTADSFTTLPGSKLLVPRSYNPLVKTPIVESIDLWNGKVSAGEIARVWGIPIRVGEVEVYKLAAPLFAGGLFCIGALCRDLNETQDLENQLAPLQSISDLIVIDCHQGSCIIYRVTA